MDMRLLANYFQEAIGIKFDVGPELMDMPDELGLVTRVGSTDILNEGLFERVQFQVAIRGLQNRMEAAEGYAKMVDDLIVFGDYPHEHWGGWVISAYRSGIGPSPQLAVDQGRRVIYVCTYTAQEAID